MEERRACVRSCVQSVDLLKFLDLPQQAYTPRMHVHTPMRTHTLLLPSYSAAETRAQAHRSRSPAAARLGQGGVCCYRCVHMCVCESVCVSVCLCVCVCAFVCLCAAALHISHPTPDISHPTPRHDGSRAADARGGGDGAADTDAAPATGVCTARG